MALPVLDVPVYETVLPVCNKKVKYRPFVVKEEKNLLIAMQDEKDADIALNMIENVVRACTFDTVDTFDAYSQVDMEWLFVQIRNKSMGEDIDAQAKCTHCGKQSNIMIDLGKVKIEQQTEAINPQVQIDDNLWFVMHFPSLRSTYKLTDTASDEDILNVIADSLDMVIKGETSFDPSDDPREEVIQWLQTLTRPQFVKIVDYFKQAPKLVYESKFQCVHCREVNNIRLEGLNDFFG